ncbi:MAG: MATE family efflux transporter [Hyphomicrobiales bacterium]|nr:MATE family efflux transporter [Hyphomicrobiales bacterium]
MRHVITMSLTSAVGLMAIFLVDLLSLLYVSWLGSTMKIAAVGFASVIWFIALSVNIGLMIAVSAVVSKALGAGDRDGARRIAGSGVAWVVVLSLATSLAMWWFRDNLLDALNATGPAKALASRVLAVTLPANVMMGAGLAYSVVLRAAGDARRAMYVTLSGGITTAFIDPVLIFGLHLDVMGAAYSAVISRVIFLVVGYLGAVRRHDLVAWPSWRAMKADMRPLATIAGPAVLANLATPVGSAFLSRIIAFYGNEAVAAGAVIDRVTPIAFGGLFALSGAVGPILGQNWGAGLYARMQRTLRDSYVVAATYVIITWVILMLARNGIVAMFQLDETSAAIVRAYCFASGPGWIGLGAMFVANASFNNLGAPLRSTLFNWGRATLGTIPFALIGAHYLGALGAMFGVLVAGVVFGGFATLSAFGVLNRIAIAKATPKIRGQAA